MPFSEELRNELAAVEPTSRCDVLAELSGLFHGAGRVHLRGRGEIALHLDLPSSAVARRAFSLLRTLGIPSEIRTYRRHAFQQATRYELHVAGRPAALELLREAGVISARGAPLERPPTRLVARPCCRGAYLRGALLAAGSLSGPSAPHLEIRASGVDGARFLAAVAAADGAHLAVLERARHAVAYAKGSEPIEQVLAAAVREAPCSRSRSAPSWPQRGIVRTGSRTPTTPTSCAPGARRMPSSRPSAACSVRASSTTSRSAYVTLPSSAAATPRSRSPSWPLGRSRA